MRHRRIADGAVPVALAGGDEHEVAGPDLTLLSLGGDDPDPLGDEQSLIERVSVPEVARARLEGREDHAQLAALVRPNERARPHNTLDEFVQGAVARSGVTREHRVLAPSHRGLKARKHTTSRSAGEGVPTKETLDRRVRRSLHTVENKRELGDFLRARREQVMPTDVGLSDEGPRRVKGLRREELASLAGVSVAYYTRLEQGHNRSPSASVLDALADALCLDVGAREHLHVLVRSTRSRSAGGAAKPERVRDELAFLLERHVDTPAMVLGRALDVLAANQIAQALHPSYRPGCNLALDVFLDETAQARYADVEQVRRNRVGSLRAAAGALPGDTRLVEIVGKLSIRSPAFRQLWARHEIHARSTGTKRFNHPDVGELELRYSFFSVSGTERQDLIVYHPERGTRHAQSLALLGTLAAGAIGPVKPAVGSGDADSDLLHRRER